MHAARACFVVVVAGTCFGLDVNYQHPSLSPSLSLSLSLPHASLTQDGVKGVVVSDENGLCVTAQGALNSSVAALAHGIFSHAVQLGLDADSPVVSVSSSHQ